MFVHVRVHYNKCPTCKQTWSAKLSTVNVIRLGREEFVCKCGTVWETGHVEWAHLTPTRRRSYFLSTAEIGVLALAPFIGGLFTFFIARNRWLGLLWGLLGGFIVAVIAVAFMWSLKYTFVRLSLRRCQFDPLTTPFAYPFFDQLREQPGTVAAADSTADESLAGQLKRIPYTSWGFLVLAVISFFWIETLWPVLLISLVLFARGLRKLLTSSLRAAD